MYPHLAVSTNQVPYLDVKLLQPHAFEPEWGSERAAGMDIRCIDMCYNEEFDFIEYGTGLAVEIPEGFCGQLVSRSSVSKTPHILCNGYGLIDSDYRGELKFRFRNVSGPKDATYYSFGDRVGQLVLVPIIRPNIRVKDELSKTVRGDGGFGSTGK